MKQERDIDRERHSNADTPSRGWRRLVPPSTWLLRLYPRAWRDRYEDEMLLVLQRHQVTLWTLLDLLVGAIDAQMNLDLLPGRLMSMQHRLRTSEIAIFSALVLFLVPLLVLQRLRDPLADWERVVAAHPDIRLVFIAFQWAGVVALLALLAGGLPILTSTIGRALRQRDWPVLRLLAVPAIAAAILVGYSLLASGSWAEPVSAARPEGLLTTRAIVLQLGLVILVVGGVVAGTAGLALAVARAEPNERLLRLALAPAAVATLAIFGGLASAATMCLLVGTEAPDLAPAGLLAMALVPMALAAGLAAVALHRGRNAARI